MALNAPEDLVSLAEDLGLDIGGVDDSPTALLTRLLQHADGFIEE